MLTRTDRNQTFANGALVTDAVVVVDITAPSITYDLHDKLRQAITGNQAALANVATATANVQGVIDGTAANITQANTMLDTLATTVKAMLTQQERMMRQLTGLERLLIGADLLVENTDT